MIPISRLLAKRSFIILVASIVGIIFAVATFFIGFAVGRTKYCSVTLDQVELQLLKLSHLKHFEIQAQGNEDLCDGLRWQMLVSHIKMFNFKFKLFSQFGRAKQQEILSSFSSPFWIIEKHWFVVFSQYEIYTVPRFAETSAGESFLPPMYRTVSDERLFYDHIFTFALNKIDEEQLLADHYRFPQVRVLLLAKYLPLDNLLALVDLSQVRYLKAPLEKFVQLADSMPRLVELALSSLSLSGLKPSVFEQIRILHFEKIRFIGKKDERRLLRMFTWVERLYIHGGMKSRW
ncbi:unnamed protein product [Rotaria sp. Silwood2]|nr:unnamed protein product [Rotaria sp. Silwood2]